MLRVEKLYWAILLSLCFISKSTGNETKCSTLICSNNQEECRQLDNLCKCTDEQMDEGNKQKVGECFKENSQRVSFTIWFLHFIWELKGSEQNVDPNSLDVVLSSLKRSNHIIVSNMVLGTWNISNLPRMNTIRLDVLNCSLSDVAGNSQKHFPLLEDLFLNNNLITEIPNFSQLYRLSLRNNLIQNINGSHFRNLRDVVYLDLSDNLVSILDPHLFQHLPRLKYLHLNNNSFSHIPDYIFHTNIELEVLNLSNNYISKLPPTLFHNNNKLENLDISNNYISKLPSTLFHNNSKLEWLYISNNYISKLPSTLFLNNSKLEWLYISNNKISNLEPDLFSYTHRLSILKLDGNKLTFLPQELLHNVISLEWLAISNNNLLEIPHSFLINAKNLEKFDVSNNQITDIPNLFNQNERLIHLDLSGNKLTSLPDNLFEVLGKLETLKLQNNQLSTFSENLFPRKVTKLTLIDLENNKLTHLPDNIFCKAPSLMDVKLNNNQFTKIPQIILCSMTSLRCDFSNNNITNLTYPINKFVAQLTIDLSNNCIQHFYSNKLGSYNIMQEFVCNNCCLSQFISKAVEAKNISLKYNNISTLDDQFYTDLTEDFKSLDLSFNPIKLQVLHKISQNPRLMKGKLFTFKETSIQCDCTLIPVLNELRTRHSTFEADCWDSKSSKFISIFEFDQVKCSVAIYLWVFIPTIFIVTIIGICLSLFCKFKPEILYFMFSRGICLRFVTEEDVSKDKVYDAFISYASQDEDWVNDSLVVPLQTGVTKYKLCLHGRDWVAGEWISDQIIKSIGTSRRTIMVLTENYLNSYWSRLEFDFAYQQTLIDPSHRLIVVLPGGVPDLSNINEEFRRFIQLTTYLDFNKPYFWSKLKSSMPRRNQTNENCTSVGTNNAPSIEMKPINDQ